MENIKLLSIVLTGLLTLSSCSNNDDSPKLNPNLTVGVWKAVKEVSICYTGSEESNDLNNCEQTGRMTFFENGTLSITKFILINGDCEEDYNDIGTWSINEDNLTFTITEETNNPTIFELTNTILRIGYHEPKSFCDIENLVSSYYTEYIRVE